MIIKYLKSLSSKCKENVLLNDEKRQTLMQSPTIESNINPPTTFSCARKEGLAGFYDLAAEHGATTRRLRDDEAATTERYDDSVASGKRRRYDRVRWWSLRRSRRRRFEEIWGGLAEEVEETWRRRLRRSERWIWS